MATIQQRPRKDGSTAYRVVWRVNGKQTTKTFDTLAEAEVFAEEAETPNMVGRRAVVTVESWDATRSGGEARVTWKWTR